MVPDSSNRNISNLSDITNLKIAANLDLLTYGQFDAGMEEVTSIFMGFESDGLFYSHPAINQTDHARKFMYLYDTTTCQRTDENYINVKCLDWYLNSKLYYKMNYEYFSTLDKFHKRLNYFPSAQWDSSVSMMIVTLCTILAGETNAFLGVICIELKTKSQIISIKFNKILFEELSDYLLSSYVNSPPQYFYIAHPLYPAGIVLPYCFFFILLEEIYSF